MSIENASSNDSDAVLQGYLQTRQIYCEKTLSVLVDGFQYAARHKKWLLQQWSPNIDNEEWNLENERPSTMNGGSTAERGETKVKILYFLSHFHSDHYTGIGCGWKHGLIFGTPETIALVQLKFGVSASELCALKFEKEHVFSLSNGEYLGEYDSLTNCPLGENFNSEVFSVFLIPANHCPGAAMFVFKSRRFGTIIHTGDFRFNGSEAAWRAAAAPLTCSPSSSPSLGVSIKSTSEHPLSQSSPQPPFYEQFVENNAYLQAIRGKVDTLFLDNTFCDPAFSFPSQYAVTRYAVEALREILRQKGNPSCSTELNGENKRFNEVHCAVLVGTYTIGKERVAFAFQEHFPRLGGSTEEGTSEKSFVPIYTMERKYAMLSAMAFHEDRFLNLHDMSSASQTPPDDERLKRESSLRNESEDIEKEEGLVLVRPLDYEIEPPLGKGPVDEITGSPSTRYFLSIFLVPTGSVSYRALARACGRPVKQSRTGETKRERGAPTDRKGPLFDLLDIGESLGIDLASYSAVLAVNPSGWNKKCQLHRVHQDRVWELKIPYSEHCSFTELLNFVALVNPRRVIPTVSLSRYRAQESLFVEKAPRLSTRFSNTQPISRFFRQNDSAVEEGSANSTPTNRYLTKTKIEKDNRAKSGGFFSHFAMLKPLFNTFKEQYSKITSKTTRTLRPGIGDKSTVFPKTEPLEKVPERQKYSSNREGLFSNTTIEVSMNAKDNFIIVDNSDDDDKSVEEIVQCAQKCAIASVQMRMLRNRFIAGCSVSMAWLTPARYKASYIYIANRKRVEMFMGKRFHLPTRLHTAAPDIAAEWNYEKNPMHLYPEIVGIGYVMPVWWKCSTCGHAYEMSVEKRVIRGGGCEICAGGLLKEEARESSKGKQKLEGGVFQEVDDGGEPLLGETNPALRPKRPAMLSIRTKY